MTVADAHARADWQRVQQLYRQLVETAEQGNLDEDLAGRLALAQARTCAAYDGEEETFVRHLLEICTEVDPHPGTPAERFRALYSDARFTRFEAYLKRGPDARRRPVPFEAAVETCRRLRDINALRDQLASLPSGCVLGGSASYGRFFNTVGTRDNEPSDLDLLLVIPSYELLPGVVDVLRRYSRVHPDDVEAMAARVEAFPAAAATLAGEERCMFSHKLRLWSPTAPDEFLLGTGIDGSYPMSLHVVTQLDFDFLILRDRPTLDEERTVYDFRTSEPDGPDLQHSFAGTQVEVERESRAVDGGFVVSSRVCHVEAATPEPGDRYFPGQHQNLVLPEVEVRWELGPHRLYLPLYSFKVKLDERLARERVQRPYEVQTLANSHTRRFAFAPYIGARVDAK